jgi:beta-glucosidase
VKGVQAGVDQFGGTERADMLVAAVRAGELSEARLDLSARRILAQKFALGLFEDPYADATAAAGRVGTEEFRAAAVKAQRRALVLLENKSKLLPLRGGSTSKPLRVFVQGVASAAITHEGWTVATDASEADVAIVRLTAPFERLHPGYVFGGFFHEGSLAFNDSDPDFATFKRVSAQVPTIAVVYLDRPAILTPIKGPARALIANFGVSDEALVDVLAGRAKPEGKLPFELPSSMQAVRAQRPDLPHDSRQPLYPFGYGLRY